MFQLFIVDDEPLVREGLRVSISWEEFGFAVAGEADNGAEALRKIEELHPDVLITDIRMGGMDGLELIRHVKKKNPGIQIIILTAYNEFSYAKAAIDNDVFAYISKPAMNEEIISVFCRLRTRLEQERKLQGRLHSWQNYRMDELLCQLLHDPKPSDGDIAAFRGYLEKSAVKNDYYIALIEIDEGDGAFGADERKRYSKILNERLNYYLSVDENCTYKANLSVTETALLIFTRSRDYRQQVMLLQEISSGFRERAGTTLTMGVSATFRSLTAIHRAYLQAKEALEKKAQVGYGKIIDYMTIRTLCAETPVLSEQDIGGILEGLSAGEMQGAAEAVGGYFHSLESRNADMSVVKNSMTALATAAVREMFESAYTMQLVFGKPIRPASDIQTLGTVEALKAYMQDFLDRIVLYAGCMQPFLGDREGYSMTVNKAVAYIKAHYAREIRISHVAGELHISESRLMHSFKQETGKTFNNWLTEYRICIAKTMIKSGHYKLYEVSEAVGYKNPITFRKAFYKMTGSAPSQYQ